MKILILYKGYPRLSHTYQSNEAAVLNKHHQIMIISFDWHLFTLMDNHLPYTFTSQPYNELKKIIKFKPDIIHSHYIDTYDICNQLSNILKIPFTIKSHSFDILENDFNTPKKYARQINKNKLCLKIIVFHEFFDKLISFGYDSSKLLPSYPTFDIYPYITLKTQNGQDIMSGGAFLPKKNIEAFIKLSVLIKDKYPSKQITYYSVVEEELYYEKITEINRKNGNPVIFKTVQPEQMPFEYKKHQWLIYTACPIRNTVGNPMMIAEAQASGVGVIMYSLRDTLEDYVSENGYLYKNDDEVIEIISRDFDVDKQKNAIELSKKRYDINIKIKDIENIWLENI